MTMTITIDNALQEAGVGAAALATGALSAQDYLQARVEEMCINYGTTYRVGIISSGDYVLRFTAAENAAITASEDPIVAGLLARVKESAEVVLYSDEVVQGVGYLVSLGFITQERAAEILAYSVAINPAPPAPEPVPEEVVEEPVVEEVAPEEVVVTPEVTQE